MRFIETKLKGAFEIEPLAIRDRRGYFSRMFCEKEFEDHGLESKYPQCNLSYNYDANTLRGLHYQAEPYGEAKLVTCTSGRIMDVIVDLRKESDTYCEYVSVILDDVNHKSLYVPKNFAHGYLTLTANTEVYYQVSTPYNKEAERGVRFDDPLFHINWPTMKSTELTISDRDLEHPRYLP